MKRKVHPANKSEDDPEHPSMSCRTMGREQARIVAKRVAARIHEVAPAGLGHWEPVWTFVADPSDVFMDALKEWAAADSHTTRSKLEAASADLIETWAEAARQWKEAGSPPLDEINVREFQAGVGELVS